MAYHRPIPDRKRRKGGLGLQSLVQAEKMMQIALLLPSAAFIGWLGGAWLDKKLHQSWIAIFGMIFGIVAGMVSAIRMALEYGAQSQHMDDENNKRSGENETDDSGDAQ